LYNFVSPYDVEDVKVSQNGKMFLNTSPDDISEINNYEIQLTVNDDSKNFNTAEFLQTNKISIKVIKYFCIICVCFKYLLKFHFIPGVLIQ